MANRNSAAIYTRISKDREGTELGVDRQEQDCRALAERIGLDVFEVFRDNDLSASTLSTKRRPGYEDMLARARAGEFGAIIAYSNSRLTRRVREFLDLIDLSKQHGVTIQTVQSGSFDLSTADGQAVATTIAAWDQAEAQRTGERIKRQKRQRAESGEWHGGAAPYGYVAANKKLILNDHEVARIKEAVRRLLDDREPLHWIIKDWNERGVTTRKGHHWRQSNLRSILMNRSLLGETKAGVRGWDPVLEPREFDRLQALFNDPSRKVTHSPGVKGGKYSMGGGLSVCGKCGNPLTSQIRADSKAASLLCNKQVQGPDPKNHPQTHRVIKGQETLQDTGRVRIDHSSLESYVFSEVLALLEDTPRWQQRVAEQDPDINKKIDALEVDRATFRDQRDRAGKAFVAGIMSERDAKHEVDRIDAALAGIEGQINELLGRPILADVLESGIDWEAWPPGRRRGFLKLLIDRVEVNDWKQGMTRNTNRMRSESDADYEERRQAVRRRAVEARVKIVWKWEA